MNAQFAPVQEEDTTPEIQDSPGGSLRAARQARGLDLEQVAGELHLNPAMIDALEQDDYSALRGQVFVVGYIRKYARLLGLDPEPLLAAYRMAVPQPEPLHASPPARSSPQIGSGHLVVRLVSTGILILLVALTFLWWQGQRQETGGEPPDLTMGQVTGREAEETADREPPSETRTAVISSGPGLLSDLESEAPPVPDSDTQIPPSEPPPQPLARDRQPLADAVSIGTSDQTKPESKGIGQGEAAESGGPAAGEAEAEGLTAKEEGNGETTVSATSEIVLTFESPCWVDVRDSERKYKLFGEMKKGERHVLAGKPPYSVILGNAAAVKISVGGTPFDISPHSRGNVARFTLDPAKTH